MTGLAAIAHYNGWMIAALGPRIVFTGLAVLSTFISQLPRIFGIVEKIAAPKPPAVVAPQPPRDKATAEEPATEDTTLQIKFLAARLQEPFQLAELYRLCREKDIPHPHLSLSLLQQRGVLHSEGGGAFIWKSEAAGTQEG